MSLKREICLLYLNLFDNVRPQKQSRSIHSPADYKSFEDKMPDCSFQHDQLPVLSRLSKALLKLLAPVTVNLRKESIS